MKKYIKYILIIPLFFAQSVFAGTIEVPDTLTIRGTIPDPLNKYTVGSSLSPIDYIVTPGSHNSNVSPGDKAIYSSGYGYVSLTGNNILISRGSGGSSYPSDRLLNLAPLIYNPITNQSWHGNTCRYDCATIKTILQSVGSVKFYFTLYSRIYTQPDSRQYDLNGYWEYTSYFNYDYATDTLTVDDVFIGPVLPTKSIHITSPTQDQILSETENPTITGTYINDGTYNRFGFYILYITDEEISEYYQYVDDIPYSITTNTPFSITTQTLPLDKFGYQVTPFLTDTNDSTNNHQLEGISIDFSLNSQEFVDVSPTFTDYSIYDCDPSLVDVSFSNISSWIQWMFCSIKHLTFTYIGFSSQQRDEAQNLIWNKSKNLFQTKVPTAWFYEIKSAATNTTKENSFELAIDIPNIGNVEARRIVFIDFSNLHFTRYQNNALIEIENMFKIFVHIFIVGFGILAYFLRRK